MKQVERYFYPAVFSYAPDQELSLIHISEPTRP